MIPKCSSQSEPAASPSADQSLFNNLRGREALVFQNRGRRDRGQTIARVRGVGRVSPREHLLEPRHPKVRLSHSPLFRQRLYASGCLGS
jgi:hypothetical protein